MRAGSVNDTFVVRLKTALVLFPLSIGVIGGGVDSFLILFSSPHLFWHLFDRITFVLVSMLIYSLVGTGIALSLAICPVRLFLGARRAAKTNLMALYLSILIVLPPASILIFNKVSFALFRAQFFPNLMILLSTASVAIILMITVYRILNHSSLVLTVFNLLSKKYVLTLAIVSIIFVILNFGIGKILHAVPYNSEKPNILFISLDTLGARHMSCYGYSKNTTPNLDRLARQGVLFEKAFSHAGWTLPSHMSMMTSTYPSVHQVIAKDRVLDSSFVTMAEILRQHGYYCGGLVDATRLGHVGAAHGFDRGFNFYEHYPERFNKYEKLFLGSHLLNFVEVFLKSHSIPIMHAQRITQGALSLLSHYNQEKPFFLFLHYYDVHSEAFTKLPYVSPPPYNTMHYPEYRGDFTGCGESGNCATLYLKELSRKYRQDPNAVSAEDLRYITSLYDGGISYVDAQIGKLLGGLERLKVAQNTLVIITADHGEAFLEHGLFTHGHYYDEIVHVPLIMRLPNMLPENKRVKSLVRLIDILPTVLDLLNIEKIDQFQGTSLLPFMSPSQAELPASMAFGGFDKTVEETNPTRYVRTDSYKLILETTPDSGVVSRELYNLKRDPGETTNVMESETEAGVQLQQYLSLWEQDCANLAQSRLYSKRTKKLKIDSNTLKELKSLGYIR